jgi:hypothetical protein
MDFSNRTTAAPAPAAGGAGRKGKSKGVKGGMGALVAVVAILVVLVLGWMLVSTASGGKEEQYVNSEKLQAVFLNTGQVYFGNVTELNNRYMVLTNIYYLQTSQTGTQANAGSNVSLVKLGCELHEPFDKMIINRDQITFWENLQDGGQVAKAVATFEKQNPNGQKCADQSSAASTNSGSSSQPAGTGSPTGSTAPTTR